MTCSSNTKFRPDPGSRRWRTLAAIVLLVGLGAPAAADSGAIDRALNAARIALVAGDGIAAEAKLREAQHAGAAPDAVRALMGEALLDQDDLPRAREWLGTATFKPDTAAQGFRMLGRLEMRSGNLPASGRAFDRSLQVDPDSAELWADIARLRFLGGERAQALEAADRAVGLDPRNPGALWFRGLLIRDQYGLQAALPWFDAALKQAPDDAAILADKAATLADLGRNVEALAALRRVQKLEAGRADTVFGQAVIAARGGKRLLARRILLHTEKAYRDVPAAMLFAAALELDSGNVNTAVALADRMARAQPDNPLARSLFARALARAGDSQSIVANLGAYALRPEASAYLKTAVARAYEEQGRRREAVALLEQVQAGRIATEARAGSADLPGLAVRYSDRPLWAPAAIPYARGLVAERNMASAQAVLDRLLAANPGAPEAHLARGDVFLQREMARDALAEFQAAARIVFADAALVRLDFALRRLGRQRDADLIVVAFATENPQNPNGLRLLADVRARNRQWEEAARVLSWLRRRGAATDATLLADLAFARMQAGDRTGAREAAAAAVTLQPANPSVRQIIRLLTVKGS